MDNRGTCCIINPQNISITMLIMIKPTTAAADQMSAVSWHQLCPSVPASYTPYDMRDLFKIIYHSLPSTLYLLFLNKMVHFLFMPSFFFFCSLCMQILSDLSELCVSVREPL